MFKALLFATLLFGHSTQNARGMEVLKTNHERLIKKVNNYLGIPLPKTKRLELKLDFLRRDLKEVDEDVKSIFSELGFSMEEDPPEPQESMEEYDALESPIHTVKGGNVNHLIQDNLTGIEMKKTTAVGQKDTTTTMSTVETTNGQETESTLQTEQETKGAPSLEGATTPKSFVTTAQETKSTVTDTSNITMEPQSTTIQEDESNPSSTAEPETTSTHQESDENTSTETSPSDKTTAGGPKTSSKDEVKVFSARFPLLNKTE